MYADLMENGGRRSVKERLNGNGTSGLTRLLGFEFGCGFAIIVVSAAEFEGTSSFVKDTLYNLKEKLWFNLKDERLQIESNGGGKVAPTSMQDLRCQSAKNASSGRAHQIGSTSKEVKVKRGKRTVAKPSKSLSFSDLELQRKKRVVGYKIYAAEGKMKGFLRKSFRWIKNTYTQALYGWW
ncbi:unnamed protein product [Sphenostylis stenocarpa]|uniref:Uncharacterized protein n=1 Tax=Sphenostylis stenocarpa TaxID=92480 RepID=A0AA86VT49_9FABA|nr:unnamed protein product [Sphenostylis stenocarpa]